MPERIKGILDRAREFFKNMKKGVKIGLIAGGAALVVLIAALVIYNATRPYEVLFAGLSQEDMASVVNAVESAGYTDVKIRGDDTVMVRANQADRLRALVIQQGFPTSGYIHDTYLNNISALSSQADREQLELYDLQDNLASIIRWFDDVQDARVIIAPGENHRYILDESVIDATATVTVRMEKGKTLTSDQVAAIQRMVAHAQQGLNISNVTVEDGSGSRYTSNDGTAAVLDETMKYKLGLESQVNEQVRNNVMRVLAPFCGADNVEVTVHSTVDVSRSYTESLVYHEPDWVVIDEHGGHGIIGTQIWDNSLVRGGDTAAGGTVGTSTNTEINEYLTQEGAIRGNETDIANYGEIEYRTSQDNIQTEHPPGTITDLTMTIVLNSAEVNLPSEVLIHAAAMAAGIDSAVEAQKIAIVSLPFYQSGGAGGGSTAGGEVTMLFGLPAWAVYAAIAGVALFLAMLLIILLLRSKKKKKIAILIQQEEAAAAEAAAAEAAALAAAAQGADIMDVHTEETMQMRQDVRKFVEENPSIAAQMIKNWLRGSEEG